MQAYGNLFQEQENISYSAGPHTLKAGFRDKGECGHHLFRNSPERGVRFRGVPPMQRKRSRRDGKHNINVGDPLRILSLVCSQVRHLPIS